jgi:hypothetical protein
VGARQRGALGARVHSSECVASGHRRGGHAARRGEGERGGSVCDRRALRGFARQRGVSGFGPRTRGIPPPSRMLLHLDKERIRFCGRRYGRLAPLRYRQALVCDTGDRRGGRPVRTPEHGWVQPPGSDADASCREGRPIGASYGHAAVPGGTHVPLAPPSMTDPTQRASGMQKGPVAELHEAPSAARATQMALPGDCSVHTDPSTQTMSVGSVETKSTELHASPAVAVAMAWHALTPSSSLRQLGPWVGSHPGPASARLRRTQGAPRAVASAWQVPVSTPAGITHASPTTHGCVAPHSAPLPADTPQTPPKHERPGPHDTRSAHDVPAVKSSWQVPHAEASATSQKPVEHCPPNAHPLPMERDPAGATQAAGSGSPLRRLSQLSVAVAVAHAATSSGVAAVPGAVRFARHETLRRVSHPAVFEYSLEKLLALQLSKRAQFAVTSALQAVRALEEASGRGVVEETRVLPPQAPAARRRANGRARTVRTLPQPPSAAQRAPSRRRCGSVRNGAVARS